jgi:hypothetical protein
MTQQMTEENAHNWPVPHRLRLKALSSLTIDAQYAQHLGTKLFNSGRADGTHQDGASSEAFQDGCRLLKDTVLDLQKTVSYLEGVLEGAKS